MLRLIAIAATLTFAACNGELENHEYPEPVDTRSVPTELQERRSFKFQNGVVFDNQFPGARLNDVYRKDDTTYAVVIRPENEPINASPWYAFRITDPANRLRSYRIEFVYEGSPYHRYWPKLSADGTHWSRADSSQVSALLTTQSIALHLRARLTNPLYIAAQELLTTRDHWQMAQEWTLFPNTRLDTILTSAGQGLPRVHLGAEGPPDRPLIVVLGRQHPPEVTGALALKSFADRLANHPRKSVFLRNYQVLIYPLLNPAGVDAGHWRHNAGGVDLNRDWAEYRQPETRAVARDIVDFSNERGAPVILGLDFHSTWKDVFYTHHDGVRPRSAIPGFRDAWLSSIERGIGGDYVLNEEAEPIGKPTAMSWFRKQFGAEGITYEVGDATPRDFVERKGQAAADALVEVLLSGE